MYIYVRCILHMYVCMYVQLHFSVDDIKYTHNIEAQYTHTHTYIYARVQVIQNLEAVRDCATSSPCEVPLTLLAEWAADFSDNRVVSKSTYGKLYDCLSLEDGTLQFVTIKKLADDMLEHIPRGEGFKQEVEALRCCLQCMHACMCFIPACICPSMYTR